MYRVRKGIGDYYQPGSWFCNNMPDFVMTSAQLAACTGLAAPAVPGVPTQAQLDSVGASSDPGTAAATLAQSLSDQAVATTQAANQAAVAATPDTPYSVPLSTVPFCGDGSVQWITGIDNCTLLEILAAGAGLIWLFSEMKGRR
jgi:hypothetical protein